MEDLWPRMHVFQYPSPHACLHSLRTCARRGTIEALQLFLSHLGYLAKHIFHCKMNRNRKQTKKTQIHVQSLNNPAPKKECTSPSATEQQGGAGQGISLLRFPPLCLIQLQHQRKNGSSWHTDLCPVQALATVIAKGATAMAKGATAATGGILAEQGSPVFAPVVLMHARG